MDRNHGWNLSPDSDRSSLPQDGGAEGYAGGFIEHYLVPIIYPSGLTQADQLLLGSLVVAVNLSAYGFLLWRRRSGGPSDPGRPSSTDSAA